MRIKRKKKVVSAQESPFLFKLKQGDLAGQLLDEGLGNETVSNKTVEVMVTLSLNGKTYAGGNDDLSNAPLRMRYTSKENRAGRASMRRR